MPGPGGNQPKKASKRKVKASPTGRYSEGYGPYKDVTDPSVNPGIGFVTRAKVSDAIRGWGSHNSKTPYGS